MKILYRIMDIFCHPSRIVFYFKDKVYVVLIHLALFMAFTMGVTAMIAYSGDYITRDAGDEFASEVLKASKNPNVIYEDYQMQGDQTVINFGVYRAYFNMESPKEYTSNIFTICFGKEKATGYIGSRVLFSSNYKDIKENLSFKLSDIKELKSDKRIQIIDFVSTYLEGFETEYATQTFIGGALNVLEFYGFLLVIMFIFSYLINPTIKFGVRARLMLYDSMIFFFVFSFAYILNIAFLEYFAVFVSLFYSAITFRHIIRVNKNRK